MEKVKQVCESERRPFSYQLEMIIEDWFKFHWKLSPQELRNSIETEINKEDTRIDFSKLISDWHHGNPSGAVIEFAEKVGIERKHIDEMIKTGIPPSHLVQHKIAKKLGMKWGDLIRAYIRGATEFTHRGEDWFAQREKPKVDGNTIVPSSTGNTTLGSQPFATPRRRRTGENQPSEKA